MPTEPQRFDPERILAALERHGVDYVMVGGFASQLHGARRQTYDIDFVPAATEANDDRLASVLRELGARLRVAGLTDEEARQLPVTIDAATLRAFGSTTRTTDAGPLDVLRELPVNGGRRTFDELIQRTTDVSVDGIVIHLASSTTSSTARPTPTAPKTTTPSPNSTTSAEQHETPEHGGQVLAGSPARPTTPPELSRVTAGPRCGAC